VRTLVASLLSTPSSWSCARQWCGLGTRGCSCCSMAPGLDGDWSDTLGTATCANRHDGRWAWGTTRCSVWPTYMLVSPGNMYLEPFTWLTALIAPTLHPYISAPTTCARAIEVDVGFKS